MDDDQVFLLPEGMKIPKALNDKNVDPNKASFSIQALNINTIALKKKNTGLKFTLIGMAAGATIGAILGFAGGDDPLTPLGTDPLGNLIIEKANSLKSTAGEKATAGAVVGGLTRA